jgi:hypothetical protein
VWSVVRDGLGESEEGIKDIFTLSLPWVKFVYGFFLLSYSFPFLILPHFIAGCSSKA